MCYICATYVLHMCYICATYVLHMCYICATYVLHMCYICATYVLHTCYLCATYVLHMCYVCAMYVLHMCYIRATYVLHTCYIRATYVLHMCYICATYVLHICYICATYVLHIILPDSVARAKNTDHGASRCTFSPSCSFCPQGLNFQHPAVRYPLIWLLSCMWDTKYHTRTKQYVKCCLHFLYIFGQATESHKILKIAFASVPRI